MERTGHAEALLGGLVEMRLLTTFPLSPENEAKARSFGVQVLFFPSARELSECGDREALQTADAVIANHRTLQKEFLEKCAGLRWVHVPHVGIERLPLAYLERRGIILTNARGIAGPPISEDVLCKMLALARRYNQVARQQQERVWKSPGPLIELSGKTAGILGTGDVGTHTAAKAKAFGMNVLGLNTTGRPSPFFDEVYASEEIERLLPQSDFLVCTLPLTSATHRLLGKSRLRLLKPSAFVINIARGDIFDEDALLDCLREKRIAGAALDVFSHEMKHGSLPPDNPFWTLENVIVTPHLAGAGDREGERNSAIIMTNIEAFSAGNESRMLNRRDYRKGY